MDNYIIKDNKQLRLGYTTGTCAASATKAAAIMLLKNEDVSKLVVHTLKGVDFNIDILDINKGVDFVSCAVRKDGGDDIDATHNMLIYSSVRKIKEKKIIIDGGIGIGRVTKKGLDQEVGFAAINSTPRKIINEELTKIINETGYNGGLEVIISAPEGEIIAKKTFNPRLGIEGGISIIGTTGVVEPMSEDAIIDTIKLEIKMKKENHQDILIITPGNYGASFIKDNYDINEDNIIMCSNYIGDALNYASFVGFKKIILIGHIGKMVKLASGMFNTHSKYGDGRKEIFTSVGLIHGLSQEQGLKIMNAVMCDEMIELLDEVKLKDVVLNDIVDRIIENINYKIPNTEVGFLTFSNKYGILGKNELFDNLLNEYRGKK